MTMERIANNETVIPLNKQGTTLTLIGAVVLIIFSAWVLAADIVSNPLVPVIGIVFLSIIGIFDLVQILNTKPGLVINDEGITDNTSIMNAGLIRWENITGVGVKEVRNQKVLVIEVNNGEEILKHQRGIKKWIMRTNNEITGSPVNISSNRLKCDFEELFNLVKSSLEERG